MSSSIAWLTLSCTMLMPWAICVPMSAETVQLADGRSLDGTITSDPGAEILVIRMTSGNSTAIVRIRKNEVQSIDPGPSFHELMLCSIAAKQQALGSDGTSEQWMDLARQAKVAREMTLARDLATTALSRDHANIEANRFLGFVFQSGVWMTIGEAAVARGDVRFRGTWMPRPEMEAKLAAEADSRRAQQEARRLQVAARLTQLNRAYQSHPYVSFPYARGSDYGFSASRYGYGPGHSRPVAGLGCDAYRGGHAFAGSYSGNGFQSGALNGGSHGCGFAHP